MRPHRRPCASELLATPAGECLMRDRSRAREGETCGTLALGRVDIGITRQLLECRSTRSWAYVAKADNQRAGLLHCVNPTWVGRLLSIPFTSLGAWFSASREVMAEFYRYLGGLHSTAMLDQCLHFLVLEDCKASGAPAQGDTYPGSRTSQRLAGQEGGVRHTPAAASLRR